MSFYMQAGNQPTKIRCDCAERFGVTINSYKQFEELKAFFEGQAEKGIFRDIPVQQPYYIGKGASHEIKWYANKWYKCCLCGTLWEFKYPNFPAAGAVRKFVDGQYPGPETDAYEEHLKDKALDTKLRFDVKYIEHNDKPDDFVYIFDASTGAPTSLTVDVQYSMAETLRRAVMNTIMGIAIVFIVLIFLSFLIYLFRFIPNPEAKKKAQAAAAPAPAPVAAPVEAAEADDTELIAVIAAAIAAAEGTTTDGFVVRSIRKINRKKR